MLPKGIIFSEDILNSKCRYKFKIQPALVVLRQITLLMLQSDEIAVSRRDASVLGHVTVSSEMTMTL